MKMSDPTPAASRPGTSTSCIVGPPRPEASISRNAPVRGEPSRVLIAAKLPAAAITDWTRAGASRLTSRTARAPSPAPMAISGPSGPSTTPRLKVAKAASTMPGSSIADGGPPPALNPSAGEWPPVPGRYFRVRLTSTPASSSGRMGHHRRFGVEAQLLGQAGEDPALQLADQREEEVGHGRDGDADDRGQRQQDQVTPGPQQRQRIGRCRHQRPPKPRPHGPRGKQASCASGPVPPGLPSVNLYPVAAATTPPAQGDYSSPNSAVPGAGNVPGRDSKLTATARRRESE